MANVGLERGDFSLLLKGWHKFPESVEEDDNPGINAYMGYGEIWACYFSPRLPDGEITIRTGEADSLRIQSTRSSPSSP